MAILAEVQEHELSDGSIVWNVAIEGTVFHCISERAADDFVDGFKQLAEKFTLEEILPGLSKT